MEEVVEFLPESRGIGLEDIERVVGEDVGGEEEGGWGFDNLEGCVFVHTDFGGPHAEVDDDVFFDFLAVEGAGVGVIVHGI